jgi:hypothetical protein
VNVAHFLDVYNPKIEYTGTSTCELIFKQIMSTERREHAHCNEISLVSKLLFLVYRSFTRCGPLIMGYVYNKFKPRTL